MRRFFRLNHLVVALLALHVGGSSLSAEPVSSEQTRVMECNKDRFDRFPVSVSKTKKVSVDFASKPEARRYETIIREAAAKGVNFAGMYVLATWGEGSPVCNNFAVIDGNSGVIVHYSPTDSVNQDFYQSCALPSFRKESSLLIFDAGCEKEKGFWAGIMNGLGGRQWGAFPTFAEIKNGSLKRVRIIYEQYGDDN